MVNLNADINGPLNSMKGISGANQKLPGTGFDSLETPKLGKLDENRVNFTDAIKNYISQTDDFQQSSDMSIKDLLSGKSEDIASVVSAAAKADMSFKLLVGVRNKLIEAYKQTMNMSL